MPVKGETASQETTRKAGRGGLALAAGKIYFIFLGLIQQIVLQRVLGLDGYGGLSTVLSLASITYNPIVSSSIQGVSRAVAQSPDEERPQASHERQTCQDLKGQRVAASCVVDETRERRRRHQER